MEIEKEEKNQSRQVTLGVIILLYFIPIAFLLVFTYFSGDRWSFLSLGLLLTSLGSLAFIGLLRKWEAQVEIAQPEEKEEVKEAIAEPDYTPYLEQIKKLEQSQTSWIQQTDKLTDELQTIVQERDMLRMQNETIHHEFTAFKKQALEQAETQRNLLSDHQKTISDLRETLDRQYQQTQAFESKVRDLNYEIKTLLQLSEKSEPEPLLPTGSKQAKPEVYEEEPIVQSPEEALIELKRCVDVAQRISGTTPFSGSNRFAVDNLTLDLRHLYDRLCEVQTSTVFVFAPKENKMLFVNNQIQSLLGISPEKFIQSFNEIIQDVEWKSALSQLAFKSDAKVNLLLKNRTGQEIPVQGLIGSIPTGIFRPFVIGVLFNRDQNGYFNMT